MPRKARKQIIGAFFSTLLLAPHATAASSSRRPPPGAVNLFEPLSSQALHMKGEPSTVQRVIPRPSMASSRLSSGSGQSPQTKLFFSDVQQPQETITPISSGHPQVPYYTGDVSATKDSGASETPSRSTASPRPLVPPQVLSQDLGLHSSHTRPLYGAASAKSAVPGTPFAPALQYQQREPYVSTAYPGLQPTAPPLESAFPVFPHLKEATGHGLEAGQIPYMPLQEVQGGHIPSGFRDPGSEATYPPAYWYLPEQPPKQPGESGITPTRSSGMARKLAIATTAAGAIAGGALGLAQAGIIDLSTRTNVVYDVIANYWSTFSVEGASVALTGLMAAVKAPAVVQALTAVPITGGGIALTAIGLLGIYHRKKIVGALTTALEAAGRLVRYVFGSKPDTASEVAQAIALARANAQSRNQSILPDNLREVLLEYLGHLSMKRYIHWVEQAVATNNSISQYLLARHALSLVKMPLDGRSYKEQTYQKASAFLAPQDSKTLHQPIRGGPFTIGTALHCIYYFTEPFIDPDIYKRFAIESGISGLPGLLRNVQVVANKQGIERAVRFMQIHVDFGLGVGSLHAHLDRNVDVEDRPFFELMYYLNLERQSKNYAPLYFDHLRRVHDSYVIETVRAKGGMPPKHQKALEHFVEGLHCFSTYARPHQALCDYLKRNINMLLNDRRVDVEATDNWHLALLQGYNRQKDQLRAARGNATFLAHTLQEFNVTPDAVWGFGLEKLSVKLIAAQWKKIREENEKVRELIKQAKQLPQDQAARLAYPTLPCMTKKQERVGITIDTLPSAADFESLTNEARLRVSLGVLYLLTGIHMDDLQEHQFNYELSLPNQLNLLVEQFCESQPGETKLKSRINFL